MRNDLNSVMIAGEVKNVRKCADGNVMFIANDNEFGVTYARVIIPDKMLDVVRKRGYMEPGALIRICGMLRPDFDIMAVAVEPINSEGKLLDIKDFIID